MQNKKSTTIDVARLAGVSQSTVSMILTGKSNVSFSKETIDKVYDAARQLNYTTKRKRENAFSCTESKLIAVIAPTLDNPYYSTLIQSLENEAVGRGYRVLICNTYRDPDIENGYLELIQNYAFCGVVFAFMPHHHEKVKTLSLSIPIVIVSDKNELMDINTVELNSAAAGELMADHLLSLGHRKVAFISTPLRVSNNTQRSRRLEGIRARMEAAGADLIVRESSEDYSRKQYHQNFEYNVGYELARELSGTPSLTAYIGVNDMVAYGILDALVSRGLRIPEDCSVCGFDNIFPSQFQRIALTTVDSFLLAKGRDAFELLVRNMEASSNMDSPHGIFKIEYKPLLIIRKTTGIAKIGRTSS